METSFTIRTNVLLLLTSVKVVERCGRQSYRCCSYRLEQILAIYTKRAFFTCALTRVFEIEIKNDNRNPSRPIDRSIDQSNEN